MSGEDWSTPLMYRSQCEYCKVEDVRCMQVTDFLGKERAICFICLCDQYHEYWADKPYREE